MEKPLSFPSLTGSHVVKGDLELVDIPAAISAELGLQVCTIVLGLGGPRDQIQGFVHSRQVLYQLSSLPSPGKH